MRIMYLQGKGSIKTNGVGTIQAEPDTAVISLGSSTENANLEAALKENTDRAASVINALFKLGIPKNQIKTSSYSIEPQYDYVDGKQVFRGYKVVNALSIKLKELSTVGEVIDHAVANGANNVYSVAFTVGSPSLYYRQALGLAVKDATAKAIRITRSVGASLDDIPYRIIEAGIAAPLMESSALKYSSAATPILPGQITVTANVEAFFSYWR